MRGVVRILAFVRKEVVDVVRQPLLLVGLVVGPFVILLVFGAGIREADPPLRTAVIAQEDTELREQVEEFAEEEDERLIVEEVSTDEDAALRALEDGDLDLVVIFPAEISDSVAEDEQSVVELYHDEIDPIESQAIELFTRTAVDEVNNRLLEEIVGNLQDTVAAEEIEGAEVYEDLNPAVLVRPLRGETQLLGGQESDLTDFYAPAVVIVLLQHLTVTLLALSVVRERELGATELFRVAPLRTIEFVLGKFLAYLLLGAVVGAALVALVVMGLGLPLGDWRHLAAALGALLFASTALGMTVALLSRTDSQAVQYAMLLLLATIFLSGFLLSLDRFLPWAQPLAWLLPATYGTELLRTIMLRAGPADPMLLGALVGYGVVLSLVSGLLARRAMAASGSRG